MREPRTAGPSVTPVRHPARSRAGRGHRILWKADGTLLATGTFAAQAGHGWQDLVFAAPVPIVTGQTYIASYFDRTPTTPTNGTFHEKPSDGGARSPVAVRRGDGNGVFCYVSENPPCDFPFPTNSYRDTTTGSRRCG